MSKRIPASSLKVRHYVEWFHLDIIQRDCPVLVADVPTRSVESVTERLTNCCFRFYDIVESGEESHCSLERKKFNISPWYYLNITPLTIDDLQNAGDEKKL